MEEEQQIEHSLEEQVQSKEENSNNQDEIKKEEDKVIHMIEANQLQGDVTEQGHENEVGKVGESQIDSIKKLKQGSRQNLKAKVTIPQPFCLATEKRMSRERRGSMDFKDSMPTLSRSGSLNYKALSQSSIGAERTSDLRRAKLTSSITTTKSSLPPRIAAKESVDKRVENGPKAKNKTQGNEIEKKKPQLDAKEGGELEIKKLRKSSTFKALPLPSFYQQKGPPSKPEIKKITASHVKSPLLGQESKSVHKSGDSKGKMVAIGKTKRSSAKETISKLHKTAPKSLSTSNEVVKGVVSL